MVLDKLENNQYYLAMHDGFRQAFAFIEACTAGLSAGRYEIAGDMVYAMVQQYLTLPAEQCSWEAHRKYINIQYLLSGQEIMEWADIGSVKDIVYDEKKDKLTCTSMVGSPLILREGSFAVFFPPDFHKPMCKSGAPMEVKKIVVKVAV